ncbi:hypothetical protein KAX97_03175 [candidate division WOR-3 bacterium]|nr:hypothetical protein [candidate division WOR-3 bacterium]
MKSDEYWRKISEIVEQYVTLVRDELCDRWDKWEIDLTKREMHEVIGGIIARQVTLAIYIASTPFIWSGHIAPIILRTMVDNYIMFAWIFKDPVERSRQYILYGLGQEKLQIEHLKTLAKDEFTEQIIKVKESWLDSQRYGFLTAVTVGSWAGVDTRTMAEQSGCRDEYNFAYTPFSAATHNMWHHVCQYNLIHCTNPLHRYHRVPYVPKQFASDIDFLYRAVKYVEKMLSLFDSKTGIQAEVPSAYNYFVKSIDQLHDEEKQGDIKKKESERA